MRGAPILVSILVRVALFGFDSGAVCGAPIVVLIFWVRFWCVPRPWQNVAPNPELTAAAQNVTSNQATPQTPC